MAEEKDIWADVKLRFKTGRTPSVDCGPGWRDLVKQLCQALDKAWNHYDDLIVGRECWRLLQVKEKMGALVVHAEVEMKSAPSESAATAKNYENRTKIFNALISKAHERSLEVCEECSEAGRKRFLIGAFKTLCDRCFIKWEDARTQATT